MRVTSAFSMALLTLVTLFGEPAHAGIVVSGGGLTWVQEGPVGSSVPDNLALVANGGSAFTDGDYGAPHFTANLNDGVYGNSNSWLSDADGDGYAGISFTSSTTLSAIAFGRDNLGNYGDRAMGTYTLAYRNDGLLDADLGNWTLIGTIEYQAAPPAGSGLVISPPPVSGPASYAARHGFNFDPVNATAVVMLVPDGASGTAIDEIELFSAPLPTVLPPPPPGALGKITWNGNDGDFYDQPVPNNLALASNGSTAYSDGDLGGIHVTPHLNNGLYGNNQSWISDEGDNVNVAGIDLPGNGLYNVTSIALSRDNATTGDNYDESNGGRSMGLYTLQFTLLDGANELTPTTGDPLTGFADIGTMDYVTNLDNVPGADFTAHLRHQFEVSMADGSPLLARGIRVVMSNNGNAIDEIEIYGSLVPEPNSLMLAGMALAGLVAMRRRRK